METNFSVLNIFSHENLVIPKDYSFSGNILISEYWDKILLLPQYGDAKLSTKFIDANFDFFDRNLDSNNGFYGVYFSNFMLYKYHAQLAYHMDIWPGSTEILDVEIHFPAFFILSEDAQKNFFKKIQKYWKIYKNITWNFNMDRNDIDTKKIQEFYNSFYQVTNEMARWWN